MVAFLVSIAVQSFQGTTFKENNVLVAAWSTCACLVLLATSNAFRYKKFFDPALELINQVLKLMTPAELSIPEWIN